MPPHQAFPIREIRVGYMGGDRSVEQVGDEIADIYDKVQKMGGEVVGQHFVVADCAPSQPQHSGVLFIVADVPEKPSIR
jgi:hypothetical protein